LDKPIKVALVRTDRRRGGVAEALALIADDVRQQVQNDPHPVVIPNLDNPRRRWTCTHRDTLSATSDALLSAGASSITVLGEPGEREGKSRDSSDRLGYRAELWNRPVRFHDIASDQSWRVDPWVDARGIFHPLCLPTLVASSRCRVCLGVAKTHEVFRVGLGLASLEGLLPNDRRNQRGRGLGTGLLDSWRGSLLRAWLGMRSIGGGMRLTRPERRRLEAVERATDGLIAVAARLLPAVALIDGFVAAEGGVLRHERRVPLCTIIAGTDAVAVDAVAAAVMGFEPLEVAYLRLAHAIGLGTADLSAITIVGDPLSPSRSFRRSASDRLLRLSRTTRASVMLPHPHFDNVRTRRSTRTEV
jgi:uncharacterized protein (DUF362 family)